MYLELRTIILGSAEYVHTIYHVAGEVMSSEPANEIIYKMNT